MSIRNSAVENNPQIDEIINNQSQIINKTNQNRTTMSSSNIGNANSMGFQNSMNMAQINALETIEKYLKKQS